MERLEGKREEWRGSWWREKKNWLSQVTSKVIDKCMTWRTILKKFKIFGGWLGDIKILCGKTKKDIILLPRLSKYCLPGLHKILKVNGLLLSEMQQCNQKLSGESVFPILWNCSKPVQLVYVSCGSATLMWNDIKEIKLNPSQTFWVDAAGKNLYRFEETLRKQRKALCLTSTEAKAISVI